MKFLVEKRDLGQQIQYFVNKIASFLVFYGLDPDWIEEEVKSNTFFDNVFDELDYYDKESVMIWTNDLIKLVADDFHNQGKISHNTDDFDDDYAGHEYSVIPNEVDDYINSKIRERAAQLMSTPRYKKYVQEMEKK